MLRGLKKLWRLFIGDDRCPHCGERGHIMPNPLGRGANCFSRECGGYKKVP